MEPLRLAMASVISFPGQPDANRDTLLRFLRAAAGAGAGLILFPESSLTGYAPDRAAELALSGDDPRIRALEEESRQTGTGICFGFMERRGGEFFLAQELFFAGERTVYRKTHPGRRETAFRPGDEFPVSGTEPRMGMQLCWESHIPEIAGRLRDRGCELLLTPYASGMGGERCREAWNVHLPARASDNGMWTAACNALLPRPDGTLSGGGIGLWDPRGRAVCGVYDREERMEIRDLTGPLPRERDPEDRDSLSYFDRKRRDLFP